MKEDCTTIREVISGFVDREASGKEQRLMQDHLRACPDCARYFEIQKVLREKMLQVPPLSTEEIEERLRRIHPGKVRENHGARTFVPFLKPALAGLAGLVIVATLLYLTAKEGVKTLHMAKNDEEVIRSLSEEERELMFFLAGENGGEEDFLEMLQDLDEMDALLKGGRAET